LLTFGAMALLNVFSWRRLRDAHEVSGGQVFAQLLADVLILTVVLFFVGGAANPFTLLYLVPVGLTVTALPHRGYAWGMFAATTVCYTGLMLLTDSWQASAAAHTQVAVNLHAIGMWLGFLISASLIIHFALSMADQLRQRDSALAQARERNARDQRLVELGTLAAGAAHELGTPLATMNVIATELAQMCEDQPQVVAAARTLRDQIQRCKRSLMVLSANAGHASAAGGNSLPLNNYLRDLVEDWRQTRANAPRVAVKLHGSTPAPRIVAERTVSQAIVNILNNSADASPEEMDVDGRWDEQQMTLEIRDRGAGFDAAATAELGRTLFSSKTESTGLGIGLLLAYSTLSRVGANVDVYSRPGGGTTTRIVLQLNNLTVNFDK
jgi:two-component system sensor histidine kinase RegB